MFNFISFFGFLKTHPGVFRGYSRCDPGALGGRASVVPGKLRAKQTPYAPPNRRSNFTSVTWALRYSCRQ